MKPTTLLLTALLLTTSCRSRIPQGEPRTYGEATSPAPTSSSTAIDAPTPSKNRGLSGTFSTGDTVNLAVYEGVRNSKKLTGGVQTISAAGQVELPKIGKVGIGGLAVGDAINALESGYRRADWSSGLRTNAHISGWNGRPLVLVDGLVNSPGAHPLSATMQSALDAAGGSRSNSKYFYLIREGIRQTILMEHAAERDLQAGDIIRIPIGF